MLASFMTKYKFEISSNLIGDTTTFQNKVNIPANRALDIYAFLINKTIESDSFPESSSFP